MLKIPLATWIANAAAGLTGHYGDVTHQAEVADCSRQTIYDHAHKVQAAVVAPVAHPSRPAMADPHQPGLLQPLQRLADGVSAGAQLAGEASLGRHGGAGRQGAGEDVGPQLGVDAIGQQHWLDQSV